MYEPKRWKLNQPPAINAANLNHIEEGIFQCSKDTIASVLAEGSGNNLVLTLTTQYAAQITYSCDLVSWLSAAAFYTQAFIDSCFTEIDIP